jgi:hypothetical protein
MRYLLVTILVLISIPAVALNKADTFRFNSGGAYHIEGYGAWMLTFGRNGRFLAENNTRGKITKCPEMRLSSNDNLKIWELIDSIHPERIVSSKRNGVPDEVEMLFQFIKGNEMGEYKVWVGDAVENEKINEFIDLCSKMVNDYCRKEAILR